MANYDKTIQVFIPMVTSDVIQSNGLTPYINFFVERMYLANNLNVFTKYSSLKPGLKFWTAAIAVLNAIALVVKIKKDWLSIKEKERNSNNSGTPNVSPRRQTASTEFSGRELFLEDIKMVLDKPTQIIVDDTLIIFRVMNFVTDKDIDEFRLKMDQTKSLFQRFLSKVVRSNVNIVTKDVFYCYSAEEVSNDELKQKIQENPHNNIVLVDQVNDLVSLIIRVKGAITKNNVKLSKLINDKKSAGEENSIDQIIKSLKSVHVSRGF